MSVLATTPTTVLTFSTTRCGDGDVSRHLPPSQTEAREKAQVKVEGADPLYHEIRIDNSLETPSGEHVRLKEGAEGEVTVYADPHAVNKG